MVVDSFDRAAGEEPYALACCHTSDKVGETCSKCIEEEAFKRMIVERTVCIRYVEAMVAGVEGCWR